MLAAQKCAIQSLMPFTMLLYLFVRTADTHNRPVPHISGHAGKLHFMEVSASAGGSSGKSLVTVGIHLDEARKFRQAAGKGLASNLQHHLWEAHTV